MFFYTNLSTIVIKKSLLVHLTKKFLYNKLKYFGYNDAIIHTNKEILFSINSLIMNPEVTWDDITSVELGTSNDLSNIASLGNC